MLFARTASFASRLVAFSLRLLVAAAFASPFAKAQVVAQDLAQWRLDPPDWKTASVVERRATLGADKWSFLASFDERADVELSARLTILEAARQFQFFGASWSAWPPADFGDRGYEAGLLLRAAEKRGFRVQLSHKHQDVALVKYPDGGYLRVVPCAVKLKEPMSVVVTARGAEIVVQVDGQEKIRFRDDFLPLVDAGRTAVGVSSGARVVWDNVAAQAPSAPTTPAAAPAKHSPKFSVRRWLGDRQWVFDGDEPVLQLHTEKDPSCFAKLRPGYKPQLTFDSHWGLENQGAFPEAASKWTAPTVDGGGATLGARWSARNVNDRFVTRSQLTVGFDAVRGAYTYDVDSQLEVLPGEPFQFRYGFDFEHHTPLDPFRWQYLVVRRKSGELYHRPVYPIDPGPQNDLETYGGLRVWYGRHGEALQMAPAIEYQIDHEWNRDPQDAGKILQRKLNTAVCAAFYDTGVAFAPEKAPPGTRLRVKYRYTGYPAREAEALFQQSKVYDSPTLDPNHHYIFADEWPNLTFRQFVPLSETWILGRTPFMTGHNQRPTYALEQNCGAGSGCAMKLGPASFGKAKLPAPAPLAPGRYVVSALVKSQNVHGPGGRIELEALEAKTNKPLASARHFVGAGSFDWRRQAFVFELPAGADALTVAFGNSGTGEMLVTDVEFQRLDADAATPADVAPRPNDQPSPYADAPAGAIADYRMREGAGNFVLNHAGGEAKTGAGSLGHLDLANIDWLIDEGRPAIRFADNPDGRKDYRGDSGLARHYFSNPGYTGKETLPIALSGHHGGGARLSGLTLAAWIKPAAQMGASSHGGRGDVIGFGARRFVLGLHNQQAPYRLAARVNVNDTLVGEPELPADRWSHVAMTARPDEGQWRVRLYLNGAEIGQMLTKKFPADSTIPPSLILGAEIFYMHNAYYRGLIGRTLVFERALSAEELADLAKPAASAAAGAAGR